MGILGFRIVTVGTTEDKNKSEFLCPRPVFFYRGSQPRNVNRAPCTSSSFHMLAQHTVGPLNVPSLSSVWLSQYLHISCMTEAHGLTPEQALQESQVEAAGFLQAHFRMSLTLLVLVRKVTKLGSDQGAGNQISHPLMGSQQAPPGGRDGVVGAVFGDRLSHCQRRALRIGPQDLCFSPPPGSQGSG